MGRGQSSAEREAEIWRNLPPVEETADMFGGTSSTTEKLKAETKNAPKWPRINDWRYPDIMHNTRLGRAAMRKGKPYSFLMGVKAGRIMPEEMFPQRG